MKNYEDMSDFEINCEVLALFEPDVNHMCLSESKGYFYDCGPVGDGWHQIDIPDYCNNPDDAWPIIVKYEIDVIQNNGQDCPLATNSAVMMFRGDDVFICQHENPLRAAMIVFLKMNEDKL